MNDNEEESSHKLLKTSNDNIICRAGFEETDYDTFENQMASIIYHKRKSCHVLVCTESPNTYRPR